MGSCSKKLLDWCKDNGERGKEVWDAFFRAYESGYNFDLNILKSEKNKVYFICNNNHIWKANLSEITRKSKFTWCPECSKQKRIINQNNTILKETDSLYDWCLKNGNFGLQVLDEFNRCNLLNENSGNFITKITYGSSKKVWFKCENLCHEPFLMCVVDRTGDRHSICPLCARENKGSKIRKSKLKNSLSFYDWCKLNGSDGEYILNSVIKAQELSGVFIDLKEIGVASRVKIPVKCSNLNHPVWYSNVNSIVKGHWCPYCVKKSSYPEQILYFWCKENFNVVFNRDTSLGVEADILIEDIKLVIEYNSSYYHTTLNNRLFHDEMKKNIFLSKGYNVLIIEDTLEVNKILNDKIYHNYWKDRNCYEMINMLVEYLENNNINCLYKELTDEMILNARLVLKKIE